MFDWHVKKSFLLGFKNWHACCHGLMISWIEAWIVSFIVDRIVTLFDYFVLALWRWGWLKDASEPSGCVKHLWLSVTLAC